MAAVEFDWDDQNRKHLAVHKVLPAEFEQLLNNDPVDMDWDVMSGEERFRSVGLTNSGRLLSAVWTIRDGRIRAVTAFPASVADKKAFSRRTR